MRCIGYDHKGKAFNCPSKAGTPWTPYWCPECDERRKAGISASLKGLRDALTEGDNDD